jgi:hypothetical protein
VGYHTAKKGNAMSVKDKAPPSNGTSRDLTGSAGSDSLRVPIVCPLIQISRKSSTPGPLCQPRREHSWWRWCVVMRQEEAASKRRKHETSVTEVQKYLGGASGWATDTARSRQSQASRHPQMSGAL